jgi:hypothetical protein
MATATTTSPTQTLDPTTRAAVRPNRRVGTLRAWMLALITSAIAFGIFAGILAWQANVTTYNAYHTIVDEGSVSVDAALRARAAILDHMSAAATFLETTGPAHDDAAERARQRWADFNNEARVSWRNVTDRAHGEDQVYAAADRAASDYIQQIGAMFAYYEANQPDRAGAAFLAARDILNTRLVPALGGLEAVKVEAMEATYAGADLRIARWRDALFFVGSILVLVFVLALFAVRRMRYRWSWPIGAALVATAAFTLLMTSQLGQASYDARVIVHDAYDSIAGVQDLAANISQARALQSIAIFDPNNSAAHLASFDQYNLLVEQKLCGPRDCTANTFLSGDNQVAPAVREAAVNEQGLLGLPKLPLIANVNFINQANRYEELRFAYRDWLNVHAQLKSQIEAGQLQAAAETSAISSAGAYGHLVETINAAGQVSRNEFAAIWQGHYRTTTYNQALALVFPLAGALAALGLYRRRSELYA